MAKIAKEISSIALLLSDGKIVFQRRTKVAPSSPGLLTLFGGQRGSGETPGQTISRELGEETSLDPSKLDIVFLGDYVQIGKLLGKKYDALFHFFQARIPSLDFEVYEGKGAEVYTRNEALKRDDLTDSAKYLVTNLLEKA